MKFSFFIPILAPFKILLSNLPLWNYPESSQLYTSIAKDHRIHFQDKMILKNSINIPIQRIYETIPFKKTFPTHHPIRFFHYSYIYPQINSRISYSGFCKIEEKMAEIIYALEQDSRKEPYIIFFENEEWLFDESILSYFGEKERQNIRTILFVDLDSVYKIINLPKVDKTLYFYHSFLHPRM